MVKKAANRASHISKKSKKPEPDNILASGTEKLVRDDSKSFNISVTRPDGTTLTYNNISFTGKNSTMYKLATTTWYSFFRPSTLANRLIKIGLDGGAERLERLARAGETVDSTDIENLVVALEGDAPTVVAVYDEIYKGIEKTYAVPV